MNDFFEEMERVKFDASIINYFDRDEPIAEIGYEHKQWAEISQKDGNLIAQFYSRPDDEIWEFSYDETIEALEEAKTRFLKRFREGSCFATALSEQVEEINNQAQEILESILNHPEKKVVQFKHKKYGPVIEIEAPGLGGVRYHEEGPEMMGFFEPYWFSKNN